MIDNLKITAWEGMNFKGEKKIVFSFLPVTNHFMGRNVLFCNAAYKGTEISQLN
jgi:hypothetical protein